MSSLSEKSSRGKLLSDAVSLIRKFSGETIVIKYGGSALVDEFKVQTLAQDLVLLKSCGIDVILVHGAGTHLEKTLKNLGVKLKFIDGVAVTNKDNLDAIEMTLSGHINKHLVMEINKAGGTALGFSGKDASMITAKKVRKTKQSEGSNIEKILDFGYFGSPSKINTEIFEIISDSPIIPVISPVGFDENFDTYIMNGDEVAGAIASALSANRLVLMSEFGGLIGADGHHINSLTRAEAEALKKQKAFEGDAMQKLNICLNVLKNGVYATHLIDAREDHSILLELLTKDRTGTLIHNTEPIVEMEGIETEDYD